MHSMKLWMLDFNTNKIICNFLVSQIYKQILRSEGASNLFDHSVICKVFPFSVWYVVNNHDLRPLYSHNMQPFSPVSFLLNKEHFVWLPIYFFFRVYAVVWWRFVFNGYHMCCHELLLIWSLYKMLKYFQKYGYLVCTHARVFLASCRTTVWNLFKCSITLHLSLPFNCSDSNDSCGFYALFNERQKQKKGILIWP